MNHRHLIQALACVAALQLAAPSGHAATISTAPGASDSYVLASSTASLALSSDVQFGFSLGRIRVAGADGASYASGTVGTVLSRVDTDESTGAFSQYLAQGGAQLRIVSTSPAGGPGEVLLSKLSVDPLAQIVYGDVTNVAAGTSQHIALFSMASLAGDLAFHGAGDYTVTASNLRATPLGVELISQALALNGLGGSALRDLQNWGSLQASFTVSAVPEPSQIVLWVLGLAALAAVRSQARQHRPQAH
jgi:hypothetical protein